MTPTASYKRWHQSSTKTDAMFTHQYEDAPKGSLAHSGYMLYLADLRFKVAMIKTFRIRELNEWISNRLG